MTMTGSMAISAAAASLAQRVCSIETKLCMATVTGRTLVAAELDGEEELVPGVEEDEDGGDADAAADLRQDDVPERLQAARLVEEGRLLHLARDVLEVGDHQPDREGQREGEVDGDQALVGVEHADAVAGSGSRG